MKCYTHIYMTFTIIKFVQHDVCVINLHENCSPAHKMSHLHFDCHTALFVPEKHTMLDDWYNNDSYTYTIVQDRQQRRQQWQYGVCVSVCLIKKVFFPMKSEY